MYVQVLGIEALITRDVRQTHALLLRHLRQIRAMPFLAHALAVLSFESNLAFESQHLLHAITESGFAKWVSLSEGAHSGLGWLTTADRKEAMALQLREAMRIGRISFSNHFFSLSMTRESAKKRLGDEMRNFSVIVEPPKSHWAKSRKTYTGKLGGLQDDVCIALQLVLTAQREFFTNPKYSKFSSQHAFDNHSFPNS